MGKGRIEAFSDGVFAIIITIMVLEMKVPHGDNWEVLRPMIPIFLSYILSFANVGIYWNNHHHMFHAVRHVNGMILWANLHLLFWLSLMPFATGWMGENEFSPIPVAVYGFDLFMCGVAYYLLQLALIRRHGPESDFAKALGSDFKGKVSAVTYFVATPLALVNAWVALVLYLLIAAMWFIPDRRFERLLG